MTDLVMKIILLIVIITVLVFIILKELKKRRAEIIEKNKNSFSKKEKKIIKKEIESSENKKSLKIVQEKPSELSKLLFNLEEMVDREDEGDYEKQNKENLNFFSTVHTPEQFGQPADLHPDTLPELIRTASRFIFGQF